MPRTPLLELPLVWGALETTIILALEKIVCFQETREDIA